MEKSRKLPEDVVTDLRALAHDLSNSLETILQASYLLSQAKLDPECKKWLGMIESASHDAVGINRKFRDMLRAGSDA
jgi:signal transduction histidine kinase